MGKKAESTLPTRFLRFSFHWEMLTLELTVSMGWPMGMLGSSGLPTSSGPSNESRGLHSPKSLSFMCPFLSSRRLSGFRSLTTTRRLQQRTQRGGGVGGGATCGYSCACGWTLWQVQSVLCRIWPRPLRGSPSSSAASSDRHLAGTP